MQVNDPANGRIRPGAIDGTGTRRRLQALVALAWSTYWLADELGRRIALARAPSA